MDPIHPIRPTSRQPAAVEAPRRVRRAGEDRDAERERRESGAQRRSQPVAPRDAEGAEALTHVDTRI
ncbi:MAG TPA: hypothetical protein VL120_02715 [Solirubrobacteraceae bacterium]|jgi:hypothetical protein|nr:hypothetical protein [Solirubrobacteraceae bacterium]